jgi:hypothetical protein
MEPTSVLQPGKIQLVRDPRIPGGIAFGMIEATDGGWYRITSESGVVASFQASPTMDSIDWLAEVVETLK